MYVLKKKCQVRYVCYQKKKKSKEDKKLFKAAINDRVGIYNVSLHSLSLAFSFSPSPPLSPKKTKSNACRRCPLLLLLLLLLRKNVNQCHLTTQMQKTKRFKYIHKSLFQSLSKKRGTMRLFLNLQKNRRFPPQDVVQPSFIDEILSLPLIFIRCMKNLCDLTKNQSTNPTRPDRPDHVSTL